MYYEEKLINGIMHCRYSNTGEFERMTIFDISKKYQELKDNYYKKINENGLLKQAGLFGVDIRRVDSIPDDVIIMVGNAIKPNGEINERAVVFLTGIGIWE